MVFSISFFLKNRDTTSNPLATWSCGGGGWCVRSRAEAACCCWGRTSVWGWRGGACPRGCWGWRCWPPCQGSGTPRPPSPPRCLRWRRRDFESVLSRPEVTKNFLEVFNKKFDNVIYFHLLFPILLKNMYRTSTCSSRKGAKNNKNKPLHL